MVRNHCGGGWGACSYNDNNSDYNKFKQGIEGAISKLFLVLVTQLTLPIMDTKENGLECPYHSLRYLGSIELCVTGRLSPCYRCPSKDL